MCLGGTLLNPPHRVTLRGWGLSVPSLPPTLAPASPAVPSWGPSLIHSLRLSTASPPPTLLSSPLFQGWQQLEASETGEKGAWESADGQTDRWMKERRVP